MKFKLLLLLSLIFLVFYQAEAQKNNQSKTPGRAANSTAISLDAQMRKFIQALKTADGKTFLTFFSRTTPLRTKNFQAIGNRITLVKYSALAADIRKKGDYYYSYLARGGGGDFDCFADHVTQGDGKMWKRAKGNIYLPPGSSLPNGDYVKWRRENGRWIISEISYNTA